MSFEKCKFLKVQVFFQNYVILKKCAFLKVFLKVFFMPLFYHSRVKSLLFLKKTRHSRSLLLLKTSVIVIIKKHVIPSHRYY